MAKNQETPQPEASLSGMSSSRIDLVKELICGEDRASTRQSIIDLEAKLDTASETLSEKLESRLQALEASITERLTALESKTDQEIARLSQEKTDRVALGKLLELLGKTLQEG